MARHIPLDSSGRSAVRSRATGAFGGWPNAVLQGKRARGANTRGQGPFVAPEDWHEPVCSNSTGYRIVVQPPGNGYRHVVTAEQIRERLSKLPQRLLEPLEVVQLSRMTRKKASFPCYGMQWGGSLYLYPMESTLVEYFSGPPLPAQRNEARMFSGRWVQESASTWKLIWTQESIRDYYLNNILIHELGHLLDNRNTSYADRERYAEWFAIEHGYRASRRAALARRAAQRLRRRRHHSGR